MLRRPVGAVAVTVTVWCLSSGGLCGILWVSTFYNPVAGACLSYNKSFFPLNLFAVDTDGSDSSLIVLRHNHRAVTAMKQFLRI